MTIERISFPAGLPIRDVESFEPASFVINHLEKAQALPTGEYDLTPKVWRKNVYKYNLIVNPDGTGAVRTLPRYKDSKSQLVGLGRTEPIQRGGRTINIPETQGAFAIMGPKRNDPQIYLFEYLIHVPGPSPTAETSKIQADKGPDESIVSEEITDINQVKRLIVEDAKQRVLALDWQRFGIDSSEVADYYELVYPLILRQSEMNFAINMLDDKKPKEKAWLERTPFDHKTNIFDNYWLVLLKDSIEPEEATLISDWLYMKAPEPIARIKNLSPLEVIGHFMLEDSEFREAGVRTLQYLNEHPEKTDPKFL